MNGRQSCGTAATACIWAITQALGSDAFAAAAPNGTCASFPLVLAHTVEASVRSNVDRPVAEYVPDRDGPLSISLIRRGVDAAASIASAGTVIEAASPALQDSEDTLVIEAQRGAPVRVTLIPTEVGGAPATVLVRFERPQDVAVARSSVQWRVMRALTGTYSLYQAQVRREQQAAAATLSALDGPATPSAGASASIVSADWEAVGASFATISEALSVCVRSQRSANVRLQRLTAELGLARASLASLKLESWEDAMRLSQDAEGAARALALAETVTRAQLLQASALIDGAVESKRSNDPARQSDSELSFKKAHALLEAALAIYRQAGSHANQAYVENYLGAAAYYAGYWDDAGRHYEAADRLYARAPRSFRRAVLTQNRAMLASDRGDYPEAERLFESAKDLIRIAPEPDMLATILENRAGTLSVLGRQDEAIAEYAAAIGIRRAQADDGGLARSLLGTGVALMRAGDLRAAQPFIEQAWALRSKTQNRDRRGWFASGLMRAELHRVRGEHIATKQTLDLIESAASSPAQQARLAVHRGRLAMDLGDYSRALAQYDIVATLALPALQPSVALARVGRLRALIGLGRLADARAELAGAGAAPQAAGTLTEIETTYLLAETEARLGKRGGALKRVDQAIATTRKIRATSLSAESRARFTASRREQDELKICLLAGCTAFADPKAQTTSALSSLLASEEARAGALAELLTSASDRREQGARVEVTRARLLAELESKLARIDTLSDRPVANTRELATLRQAALEIERRLRGLDASTPDGGTREIESSRIATEVNAILRRLPPDTTVLEFFLGRQSALVWVLASGTLQVREIATGPAAVAALRRDIRALLELSPTDPSIEDRLSALGRLLLQGHVDPVTTKRLLIVPDGELFFTPFAALRVTPSGSRQSQPLTETTETILLPALSQLTLDAAPVRALAQGGAVTLVADPVFDSDDARVPASVPRRPESEGEALYLPRLPATTQEVRAVQALLPNARVTVLSGTGATREAVLSALAPGVAVAHLATHGVIRASNPGLSFLALSAYDRNWRPVPVRLYGTDILSSGARADLVVLSACRSAIGDVVPGEGPLSLSYSFLANGSGSVIAPIWPVPDAFAAGFMGAFYRSLATDGLPPASALRNAQAWARRSGMWSSPYYWAAFSLTSRHLW